MFFAADIQLRRVKETIRNVLKNSYIFLFDCVISILSLLFHQSDCYRHYSTLRNNRKIDVCIVIKTCVCYKVISVFIVTADYFEFTCSHFLYCRIYESGIN